MYDLEIKWVDCCIYSYTQWRRRGGGGGGALGARVPPLCLRL